jgi:hypothetical protein
MQAIDFYKKLVIYDLLFAITCKHQLGLQISLFVHAVNRVLRKI